MLVRCLVNGITSLSCLVSVTPKQSWQSMRLLHLELLLHYYSCLCPRRTLIGGDTVLAQGQLFQSHSVWLSHHLFFSYSVHHIHIHLCPPVCLILARSLSLPISLCLCPSLSPFRCRPAYTQPFDSGDAIIINM